MENYWDGRYHKEGKIWGDTPSVTAWYACRSFLKSNVKKLLIPGIGYGRNARVFVDAGFEVEGIEVSPEAARILKDGLPGVKCSLSPVQDVQPGNECYDAIYCFNVLHLLRSGERRDFLAKCFAALKEDGPAYFAVFSDREASFGKGREVEPNTFESKPGRPVHYFSDGDIREHFKDFIVRDTGLVKDMEDHGDEGRHVHVLRYILAQKRSNAFDGEKYKGVSRHQKEWGSRIIDGLNLRGDEHILDLGCGDGVLTAKLAAMVPDGSVLGIDSSASMIATARELERGNFGFRQIDINDLDFNGAFDLIFSNAALHWVKDHDSLLANVARCLKTGGSIRFSFAGDGNCANFIAVIKEAMALPTYASYFKNLEWPWYMPKAPEYEALVKARFDDVEVWVENADRHFTRDELIGWIDQPSILPFLRYIDGRDRAEFRDRVVERMLERTRQDDGTYFETFRRINVLARKRP